MKIGVCLATIVVILINLSCGASADDTASSQPFVTTNNIPIIEGDYIFIGQSQAAGLSVGKNMVPVFSAKIGSKNSAKWELNLLAQLDVKDDKKIATIKWDARIRKGDENGVLHDRFDRRWTSTSNLTKADLDKLKINKIESPDGIRLYIIAYIGVDGSSQYVMVAISSKIDLFPKVISISKDFILWDWNHWALIK